MRYHSESSVGAPLIHCTSGISRSAALIAIDMAIDEFRATKKVQLKEIITGMRNCRMSMIQAYDQVKFAIYILYSYDMKSAYTNACVVIRMHSSSIFLFFFFMLYIYIYI